MSQVDTVRKFRIMNGMINLMAEVSKQSLSCSNLLGHVNGLGNIEMGIMWGKT